MSVPIEQRLKDSEPRIHPTAELKSCRLGRYSIVGERVVLRDVELGNFSYFERHAEAIYTSIGKFCSIASNTRLNALEHPIERITSHKVSYRPNEYFHHLGLDSAFRERRKLRQVSIGHDVWIGHGAVVVPGVSIGMGAVVGANSVVTKNVGAFEIVAGVPARRLRMRFPDALCERIGTSAWWDWPLERLVGSLPDMQTLPIEAFLDRWEA